jgi:hypothetical protein
MAGTVVDTTAIAAIVIGLGGTVAAMVYPLKYPNASKWAVNLSWWGGLSLVLAGVLYLLSEHASELGHIAVEASVWGWSYLVALQRLPGFWIAVAFVAGLASYRWLPLLWKKLPVVTKPIPQVAEWFSSIQAADKFVDRKLLLEDRLAVARAHQLREKAGLLEAGLRRGLEPERAPALREQLESALKESDDAEYAAKRRRTDVVECLRGMLRTGVLVAKGRKLKMIKGEAVAEPEDYIAATFWAIIIDGIDSLDFSKNVAHGGYPHQVFRDVMIGKPV